MCDKYYARVIFTKLSWSGSQALRTRHFPTAQSRRNLEVMLSGRLPTLLLAALVLAYFGPLIYAASTYPSGYDWQHTVVSNLANPRTNPGSWRVAADGIALTGVLLAMTGFGACRVLRPFAPRWTSWASAFFVLGGTLLTVSALITPGHMALLGLAKAHAKIAQAASFITAVGMVLDVPALLRLPPRFHFVRVAAIVIAVGPMVLFLVCRFVVPLFEHHAAEHGSIDDVLLGGLAFWEWVGSTAVIGFLALVLLGIGGDGSKMDER